MTSRTQQTTPGRWMLPFLAALVAVLATLLSSASASAATTTGAETRVRASAVVVEVPVGPPERIAAGQRLGNDGPGVVDVVATGVAAKSVPNPKPVLKPNGAPDRSSPWYVSYRDADGNIQTVGNLDGVHAEVRIQQMQPGASMSKPFGWRTRDSAIGPEWVEGTVCAGCQVFPRGLFAPGTRGAPGGPWGD